MGGGIIILIHHTLCSELVDIPSTVLHDVETCSAKIYPTSHRETALLLTRVYIPPDGTHLVRENTLDFLRRKYEDEETHLNCRAF